MATYSANILPTDAAKYTLKNASFVDGIISLQPNGSVTCSITSDMLRTLTEWFRVSVVATSALDNYTPWLYVYIRARTVNGVSYNYTCAPTQVSGNIYTSEIQMESTDYAEFVVTLYSARTVNVTLLELCPEALATELYTTIEGVERSLPSLLFDYNTEPLAVEQNEKVVGTITFNLLRDTDLNGHLEMSYIASSDCVLTIRVKDTGITELYAPIVYDIKAGRGNIALPHAYLKRKAGMHQAYITAQVSSGQLAVVTRGLLYTIDGGNLASRMLDAGIEVVDFSVKQLPDTYSPSELWAICIDSGECTVRSVDYGYDSNGGTTPRYALGSAVAAAIEFNGYFGPNKDTDATGYTLFTEEYPYNFWIDTDSQLWCQHGGDESTRFMLDTSATRVAACRGYSSALFPEQDQGLIVVYIKNGVATYKNYCYDTTSGEYTWQGPFTVPVPGAENVIDVSIHRLNDYRVGIVVTTTTANYWAISSRTYVAQAAPSDVLHVDYNAEAYVALMSSNTDTTLDVAAVLSDDRLSVTLTFSKDLHVVHDDAFVLSAFSSTGPAVSEVSIVDARTVTLTLASQASSSFTVTYNTGAANILYYPITNAPKPVLNFAATVDILPIEYAQNETINVSYNASAEVLLRGKGTLSTETSDSIVVAYDSSASINYNNVTYSTADAGSESIVVNYQPTGNITLTQTGSKPI